MQKTKHAARLLAISFALASSTLTSAQQPATQKAPPQPPSSGLGKQVAPQPPLPEVVRPRPSDAVEQAIQDIEDTQLNDEQYRRLKRLYLRAERQKSMAYITPAKPITRTLPVNLNPGADPPVIRVTKGMLSSIVFSDANGNPWFIEDVGINREMFNDGRSKDAQAMKATNVLKLEPLSPAAFGNATVTLKGLSTPVIFVLTAAQQEVDMRVDVKVPGRNPDAPDTITLVSMPSIDESLTSFLDGVPPKDAKRLRVTGLRDAEAWSYRQSMYLRTPAEAHYPAYMAAARSTSGMAVYRFHARPNSVTLLDGGRAVTVFIEE